MGWIWEFWGHEWDIEDRGDSQTPLDMRRIDIGDRDRLVRADRIRMVLRIHRAGTIVMVAKASLEMSFWEAENDTFGEHRILFSDTP